jgi:signal transduction histidine kinase
MTFDLIQELLLGLINVSSLLIGYVVLKSNPKDGQNRWFFVLSILIILWVNFAYVGSSVQNAEASVIFYKMNMAVVAIFLFAFYYFFVAYFLKQKKKYKIIDLLISASALIIASLSLFSDSIVYGVSAEEWGMGAISGSLMWLFNIFALFVSFMLIFFGFKQYATLKKPDRRKINIFFIGILIFIVANVVFNVLLPVMFDTYEYQHLGDFSVIFFLVFAAYDIIRHHLFDVKSAIVRSVMYVFVLMTFAFLYIAIMTSLSVIFGNNLADGGQIASGFVTSIILALSFQPVKAFFDRFTNNVFYKEGYSTEDFFARISSDLTAATELRSLLKRLSYEIASTLKSEQVLFFIKTSNDHYLTTGTENHKKLPKKDVEYLDNYFKVGSDALLAATLSESNPMYRLMMSHRLEVILPLSKSDKIIGYLCLGSHLASGYSGRDVRAINAIADELVIAIQNSLAVEEIRELNSSLQQRVANATRELRANNSMLRRLDKAKDEFVSMASHQLRTPLTSVKGYISMVLEGDAGDVNDTQRHFLDEAFLSSERMVRLIDDFLNVSRIQTGKFIIDKHDVNLSKVVAQEIDSLQPSAMSRNLKFIYHAPKNCPVLNLDESKIRQVIMNFADNALYYSHEDQKINIDLSFDKENITFTVKDHGIGVPSDEQDELFSKFYRASNARKQRPDGTGVGLYLAKKIIDAHEGKIIFESTEGKGSTFGFSLPIN